MAGAGHGFSSDRARSLAVYVAVAALSLAAAVPVLGLRAADLRVPFSYSGDALLFATEVKAVVDNGWCLNVPQLGAPGVMHMHDFPPQLDGLHLLIVKAMTLVSHDWALLFNVYYLLGFPLIAGAALWALRRFGIAWAPAAAVSVLYAFLPSRLCKAQGHLFLDTFFEVPLAIVLVLWTCGDDPPLARDRGPGRLPALELRRPRSRTALALAVLVGATGIYYATFAGWLLVAGGVWASARRRSARPALAGVAMAAVIAAVVALHALPTALYRARHGANPTVVSRLSGEAEIYGLKIAQLLLPIDEHRVAPLAELKRRYNQTAPLVGENSVVALGVVGGVGFLWLLGAQLAGRRREREGPLAALPTLNLMAVLLGTIGGFGSLFAVLVSPVIRTYCRVNVFISFFALCAVAWALDGLWRRRPRLAGPALVVILVVGLYDQATPLAIPAYAAVKQQYVNDGDLIHAIERSVPARAMIFQLPFQTFPEPGRIDRLNGYESVRPYLQSRALRWSYGAMRGRDEEVWIRETSRLPPVDLVAGLRQTGFAGILIDRFGYADSAAGLAGDLALLVGPPALESKDGRLVFFRLGPSLN